MKALVVADSFVQSDIFKKGLAGVADDHEIRIIDLDQDQPFTPSTPSERSLRETAGHPSQLIGELHDEDVLVVHGAPVTDAVMDASPRLRLICVARGGPVNVDLEAATKRGIAVVFAPGRNADTVADLTLALMIMLGRGVLKGIDFVRAGNRLGDSAFEGAQFFGNELDGHMLGLIGFGRVGARVAHRAQACGMTVTAYDPYVAASDLRAVGVEPCELRPLIARSDYVSLHARVSEETVNLFGRTEFRLMKPTAFFLNAARDALVDEDALYEALVENRIAGAALDVVRQRPAGSTNPLLTLPNVIVTPHIGGATSEAALRGVLTVAADIQRYLEGIPLKHQVNPTVIAVKRA
jgi:phosphoglycerate dehydrogenase-like enzyme